MKIGVKVFLLSIAFLSSGLLAVHADVDQAMNLANLGRFEEAVKLLQKPSTNEERVLLARLLDYEGQPEAALRVLEEGLKGTEADLDLLAELCSFHSRMGHDGPTVSYKRGSVCYSPSKDEKAEAAYKKEHFMKAIALCDQALGIRSDAHYFKYQKAATFVQLERYKEALELYEELKNEYPELQGELASLYMQCGMTNEAVAGMKKAIELNPQSAEAYGALSTFYEAAENEALAVEYDRKAKFYGWVPSFIQLDYTPENYAMYEIMSGAAEMTPEERVQRIERAIVSEDESSTAFLAALCYHHSDHGPVEEKAFKALEEREEAGIPILLELFNHAQSVCTARQAAEALANQRCGLAVDPLIASLPSDVRFIWTHNAAECLAKIGESRAVPELIRMADVGTELEEVEDDPMQSFAGRMAARYRAVIALGAFKSEKDNVSVVLLAGTANHQMAPACYSALFRLTGDNKYFDAALDGLTKKDSRLFWLSSALAAVDDGQMVKLAEKVEVLSD